jgi:hypothetical protein
MKTAFRIIYKCEVEDPECGLAEIHVVFPEENSEYSATFYTPAFMQSQLQHQAVHEGRGCGYFAPRQDAACVPYVEVIDLSEAAVRDVVRTLLAKGDFEHSFKRVTRSAAVTV